MIRSGGASKTQGSGGASKAHFHTAALDTAHLDSSKLGREPAAPHVSLLPAMHAPTTPNTYT